MSTTRGACPSLSAPMQTGDGLLARLKPVEGRLYGRQLAGLAEAAERFGNGILEITARGSLQIRGLTAESAPALAVEAAALGIAASSGVAVEVGPLAGLDGLEIADPRPLAQEIRKRIEEQGFSSRLGPKVSVTVDGGGALDLSNLMADVKLEAVRQDDCGNAPVPWLIRVGGTSATARILGWFDEMRAIDIATRILRALSENGRAARARGFSDAELKAIAGVEPAHNFAPSAPMRLPVGRFKLSDGASALGFALAYGRIGSDSLAAFAEAIGHTSEVRLSPGRGLIVLDTAEREDVLFDAASKLDVVSKPDDPRLSISICAGKPACASAHLATRQFAGSLIAWRPDLLDGSFRMHLSGCDKQCARPSGAALALIATESGHHISAEGATLSPDLKAVLTALADEQSRHHDHH